MMIYSFIWDYVGNIGNTGNGYTIQTIFTRVFEDLHTSHLICILLGGEWRSWRKDFRLKGRNLAIFSLGLQYYHRTTLLPL